jgi:hypothetical protein
VAENSSFKASNRNRLPSGGSAARWRFFALEFVAPEFVALVFVALVFVALVFVALV